MSPIKPPPDRANGGGTGARVLAYVAVALLLAGYFVWVCVQMAAHVRGGDALLTELLIGIVAVAIALVAGAIGGRGRATSSAAADAPPKPVPHRDPPRTRSIVHRPRRPGSERPIAQRGPGRRARAARHAGRAPGRSGRS